MIARNRPLLNIVILAAGFSSRLGEPKARATVRGASLLARTLRTLGPFARSPLLVVIPPRVDRRRLAADTRRVRFLPNARRSEGMSTSVRRGIAAARYSSGVLLLPVDLVDLQGRDLSRLISRWLGARRRVVGRHLQGGAATPLVLPRHLYARALGITGDRGLREFNRALPRESVSLVHMPSAAADVDTRQDLEDARRRIRPPSRGPSYARAVCTKR